MKLKLFPMIFSFLICLDAYAFKFSPMSTSIGIKAGKNSTLFYLENDSDQAIAVTASLLKREMSVEGIETNVKISDELSVYPSQLIIPPNEKRSVKVTWTGKTIPPMESAYRLVAEQLPIELDKNIKKKASIKVLLRYVAALYVEPEDFNSDVNFKNLKVDDKNVSFLLDNKGKKHQVLSNLSLKVSGKKDFELSSDDLKGMTGENILAQSERLFSFPRVGKFRDIQASDKVKLNFEKD
jgi:fimbrial chaperone protein